MQLDCQCSAHSQAKAFAQTDHVLALKALRRGKGENCVTWWSWSWTTGEPLVLLAQLADQTPGLQLAQLPGHGDAACRRAEGDREGKNGSGGKMTGGMGGRKGMKVEGEGAQEK